MGLGLEPGFYEALLHAVRPRLVIPIHWDDLFRPLDRPLRPALSPPTWRAPLRRMNPGAFARLVAALSPTTRVLVPELFHGYEL